MKRLFDNKLIVLVVSIAIIILIVFISSIGPDALKTILILILVHIIYLLIGFIRSFIQLVKSFIKEEMNPIVYLIKWISSIIILLLFGGLYVTVFASALVFILPFLA